MKLNQSKVSMFLENRLVVAKKEGVGGGTDWEFGLNKCEPSHKEWVSNKVLLDSTGNDSQDPVKNQNGKRSLKRTSVQFSSPLSCV